MKLLLKNCLLIDGTGRAPMKNAWILTDGANISAIGSDADILPGHDKCIDVENRAVLPGLCNAHVHIQRRHLHQEEKTGTFRRGAAYVENLPDEQRMLLAAKNAWTELKHGVTSLRDCGSKNRTSIELKHAIKDKIINGPDVFACGVGIASTGGHETHLYSGAVEADGPDEIIKAVRNEIKHGADFIKFMCSGGLGGMPDLEHPDWLELNPDELRAGVREAHNRRKKTTAHAMGEKAVNAALEAGIDCIEHGTVLSDDALDFMKTNNVFYVPTISGIEAVVRRVRQSGRTALADEMDDAVLFPLRNSVRKAIRAGIRIASGTDTLGDLIDELDILNKSGMTCMECIVSATKTGAEVCQRDNIAGTIEINKKADILVVSGNPAIEITDLRNVYLVIKDGRIVNDIFNGEVI